MAPQPQEAHGIHRQGKGPDPISYEILSSPNVYDSYEIGHRCVCVWGGGVHLALP